MLQTNPMNSLYRRLSGVGLTRNFVRETALPSWWDDEIAVNPAGYAQGLMLLARHLGLELDSLQDESVPLKLRDFGVCKYKKRAGVSEDELALARVMATRAAQLAAEAMSSSPASMPATAADIRQQILDGGARWVGLRELLDYCWSAGIPVLHVDHFPTNARRPDGFAARVHGRSVIVICRRARFSAWLLFILAHELGHVVLGHVADDGTLIDDHLDEADQDTEERQANDFAVELLTGHPDKRFVAECQWPNAQQLAAAALAIGQQNMVDPGHIALNYAHSMGKSFFPVGNAALNLIEPPQGNAVETVRNKMAACLDWSRLPDDSSEFLMRVTRQGLAP